MRATLDIERLSQQYADDGFCVAPAILPPRLLAEASVAAEAVAAGESDTGLMPRLREREQGEGPQKLVKIAEPHNASQVLRLVDQLSRALAGSSGGYRSKRAADLGR